MTSENRRYHAELFMDLARERLRVAEQNLSIDAFMPSSSQAYYAMFYAANALLTVRDIHRHRHREVVSEFCKEFAKTGDVDRGLGRAISEASKTRLSCDYKPTFVQSEEAASKLLENAKDFLVACEKRLVIELGALEQKPGTSGT